jgi:alanine racemase
MFSSADNIPSVGVLTVDVGALASNWLLLLERMKERQPSAECAAVVKANAYGLGVLRVSKALWLAGCRLFFVSTLLEAIELREIIGNEAKIIVFGGLSHGVGEEWGQYQLIPVLFDKGHLEQWAFLNRDNDEVLPCVLKVDTGMNRLGLSLSDIECLCVSDNAHTWCSPLLMMSHLACADTPDHPLNCHQLANFLAAKDMLQDRFPEAKYSLANSSGLFLGDDFIFDVGRPGAALYGINPAPSNTNPMNAVVNLQLPIMQIKTIPVGESVGYGGEFTAQRTTRVAIVFGGYADGLLRALSSSGFAYLSGQKIPIVGRVSMDSMVFDITDVHPQADQVAVDIIGIDQSIDDLATSAGTIAYELLTSLGGRYKRDYVGMPSEGAVL